MAPTTAADPNHRATVIIVATASAIVVTFLGLSALFFQIRRRRMQQSQIAVTKFRLQRKQQIDVALQKLKEAGQEQECDDKINELAECDLGQPGTSLQGPATAARSASRRTGYHVPRFAFVVNRQSPSDEDEVWPPPRCESVCLDPLGRSLPQEYLDIVSSIIKEVDTNSLRLEVGPTDIPTSSRTSAESVHTLAGIPALHRFASAPCLQPRGPRLMPVRNSADSLWSHRSHSERPFRPPTPGPSAATGVLALALASADGAGQR